MAAPALVAFRETPEAANPVPPYGQYGDKEIANTVL